MRKGDNGKGKAEAPEVKDYVVLNNLLHHSLQKTLDLYSQEKWQLMACVYSPSTLYTMIFRRKLTHEY